MRPLFRALLATLLLLAVALSCQDSVTLPPVQGPPLQVPELRGEPSAALAERPLAVIHFGPRGQLLEPQAQIVVSFNKPVVALERVDERAAVSPLVLSPAVPGKQRWLGSRTLTFAPDAPLPGSTTFTVTLPKGLKAVDGAELREDLTYQFTTPKLEVSQIIPPSGAKWQTSDTRVTLNFNQPVRPDVLERHVSLVAAPRGKGEPYVVAGRVRQGANPKQAVVHPATALPRDATITVRIASEMASLEGPLPMGKPFSSTFSTFGPFRAVGLSCTEGCDPDGSVTLEFSNPVPEKAARQAVRINGQPLRGGSTSYASPTIYLDSRNQARTRFAVTVDATLKDKFGQTLEGPRGALAFTTGDFEPMVRLPLDSGVLEARGPRRLPIVFRNAEQARLHSKRLGPGEVAELLGHESFWDTETPLIPRLFQAQTQDLRVTAKPNARVVQRVDLGTLVGQGGTGVLALELEAALKTAGADPERRIRRAVVRITDLALTAKWSPHTSLLWATSLSRGLPAAGCEVAIYKLGGGTPLWSGTTDASGLAVAPGVTQLLGREGQEHRLLFTARKGNDESFVAANARNGISAWDFGLDETWEDGAASLLGLVFSDRGIYRPGDTVHFKGILRRTDAKGLSTPHGVVEITVTDSRGEKLVSLRRELSEFGSFDFTINLPPAAPLGSYSVVSKHASGGTVYGSFSVEEYRPAEFKVETRAERPEYVRGDTMSWRSNGSYLFGAPMRGAKASWTVHQSRTGFQPPKHEGFVFSDEVRWWDGEEPESELPLVARGAGQLDAQGNLSGSLPLKPPQMSGPLSCELEVEVTDISRQTVASRAGVILHPGEFYIGAKPKETFLKAGETLEAELVAVTPQGERLAGKSLTGTLYRRTWHSVRKLGMGGAHTFVTRPQDTAVGRCAATSSARTEPCKISVSEAGYYFLRLTATDGRGNPVSSAFGVYAAGAGYVPWRMETESRLKLVPDRERYKLGQVARVLVKSPYTEAHGLFTVERNGIFTRRPIHLKGSSTWLEVPITAELVPNAFVSLILVRGRVPAARGAPDEDDPGQPAFKVGYAKLSVSEAGQQLALAVRTPRPAYRPGEEVAVELSVKDAQGKPAQAEIAVIVADEGVLSLIGYRTPDPMAIFYAERGLSVRTADARTQLISRRVFGEKGNNPGGGGGELGEPGGGGMRKSFVTTPYFNPAVLTDGSGKARVTFKLPDNLTTFRIMAVASTSGAAFGSGQTRVLVNKPLLLLPTLPRLVRVGDEIEAGVAVHNQTGKTGPVRVRMQVTGLELVGLAETQIDVAQGSSAEARFKLLARAPGEAVLRFAAELGDDRDAVELKRPVKLPLVVETVATHGSTTSGAAEGIVPSSGIRSDVGGLEVAMSSSALVGLKGSVEYLMDYPYECLEQTTSRLVPLVMLKELTRAYQLGKTPQELETLVALLVGKIETQQRWHGGFSYWPSAHDTSPWLSAYATFGLHQAKAHGYAVSQRALERARSYLKTQLQEQPPTEKDQIPVDLHTRVFLAYVLAELGENVSGYLSRLYERREELAAFGRALLLSALVRGRADKKMIEAVSAGLLNQVHQTGRVAKVEENLGDSYAPLFHSDLRSTALVLDALLKTQPEHPLVEKLVRHLVESQKDGHWSNTQENVYALLALGSFYRVREHEEPDFQARVVLGSSTLLGHHFVGRSLKVREASVPMKGLLSFQGPLGFLKEGTGRLYYSARLRYARDALPKSAWDEGFYVTRTYEAVSTDPASIGPPPADPNAPVKSTSRVKAGDLVRVTLRVVVPQHAHFVAIDDPLPAGLEALNFRLMTATSGLRRGVDLYGFQPRHSHRRYRSPYFSPFYHQEIRDDRVLLFADSVPPGVHSYAYLARATTIGKFVAAPTHVEQMYEPEVFGRTGASTFEVSAR